MNEYLLGPHQISDGTLRFMALATLFLQPRLPNVIVLDEPELGLHPSAIVVLAALAKSAATRVQVILATQSTRLVDEFKPGQIAVLEADAKFGTQCRAGTNVARQRYGLRTSNTLAPSEGRAMKSISCRGVAGTDGAPGVWALRRLA